MEGRTTQNVLAIDIGASSGRAMLASFDGQSLALQEVHRFENTPVQLDGTLYWDILRLWHEVKQGIAKAAAVVELDSIGVDTWGVDFGLLDGEGRLLANPVHYRDGRTRGIQAGALQKMNAPCLYGETGVQLMDINTVFQLAALQKQSPGLLGQAETLLLMPDLLTSFLTGTRVAEMSIASTSQLYSPAARDWSDTVVGAFGLPRGILPPVVAPGTRAGRLRPEICEELGVPPTQVVSVCGHDTQSAMVAAPAREADFIFLSSGTWSLMGTELDTPVLHERARAANLSNESAYGGKTALLSNITGLWLVQESRRQWRREGIEYSFAELEALARAARPLQSFILPDAPVFATPGNLPGRVRAYCRETGQPVPETHGAVVRCILESLALTYRLTLGKIAGCTGKSYGAIHIVGGGAKDALLCQMAADACGTKVVAGPVEATALGNALVQLMALGAVQDLPHARALVATGQDITSYAPLREQGWQAAYEKYTELLREAHHAP